MGGLAHTFSEAALERFFIDSIKDATKMMY
jgi:hypothetical protein